MKWLKEYTQRNPAPARRGQPADARPGEPTGGAQTKMPPRRA
jgi:hypothetical protein